MPLKVIVIKPTEEIDAMEAKADGIKSFTLAQIDNHIDQIGNLTDAKVFFKRLVRYIIASTKE